MMIFDDEGCEWIKVVIYCLFLFLFFWGSVKYLLSGCLFDNRIFEKYAMMRLRVCPQILKTKVQFVNGKRISKKNCECRMIFDIKIRIFNLSFNCLPFRWSTRLFSVIGDNVRKHLKEYFATVTKFWHMT